MRRTSLAELDHTRAEISSEADPAHGTLRFGFPLTMGSGHVPDLLAAFRHRHPGIRVLLKQAHGTELGAGLLTGNLDLAVVTPAPERLHHITIGAQNVHLTVPGDHRRASASQLRLDELAGETFIANPPSYNLRQLAERWCRDAGYVPNIAIEVTEFSTIGELIGRGLGVALLPHDDRMLPGIREIPLLGDNYHRSIALAWGTATRAAPTMCLNDFILQHFSQSAVNNSQ